MRPRTYFVIGLVMCATILSFVSLVSSMSVDFYHHPSCSHCKSIFPLVEELDSNYPHTFNYHDVSIEEENKQFASEGFTGVPSFVITTPHQEIKFSGSDKRRLNCEVQQMSTLNCPTLSADRSNSGSWFE